MDLRSVSRFGNFECFVFHCLDLGGVALTGRVHLGAEFQVGFVLDLDFGLYFVFSFLEGEVVPLRPSFISLVMLPMVRDIFHKVISCFVSLKVFFPSIKSTSF